MTVQMLNPPMAREADVRTGRTLDPLPVQLEIDGQSYRVTSLTEDGLATAEFDGVAEQSQIIEATIEVAIDGFNLSVATLWEVISHDPSIPEITLLLAPVNPPQSRAMALAVIRSITAETPLETADGHGLAHEWARMPPASSPAEAVDEDETPGLAAAIRRRAGAIMFALLALALLVFIAASLASRALIVQANGTIINAQAVLVGMPEAGEVVTYLVPVGSRVTPGTPIAQIKSLTGTIATIASSCDCVVASQLSGTRSLLRAGDPILQTIPVDGANKALIAVPLEDLRRIRIGDEVTATFYDSRTKLTGKVEHVSPPKIIDGTVARPTRLNGTVEVRFADKVPAWRVGEPILARVRLTDLNPFD